jgi:23S rRNA (uracil1939-C5)-methyltransferase
MVQDALERIGHLAEVDVLPTEPSPLSFGYRNKIQLPIIASSDCLALGLYARHSHKVIEIDHCLIHTPIGEETLKVLRCLLAQANIPPYLPHNRQGELRHVLLRTALSSQEVLCVIITARRPHAKLYSLAQELMQSVPKVKGVVHCLNRQPGNTVLTAHYTPLAGTPYIQDHLCGLTFKISAASFFQVNPLQCEKLYRYALKEAQLHPESVVLDGYCGVGTLALLAAQQSKQVVGIESVPMAIEDANQNSQRNAIHNVSFLCGRVERLIGSLETIDVALLNPPRKGCDETVIRELVKKGPRKIVYISCNPATLARDLYLFKQLGYPTRTVCPFDMFPQTAHVECVATLDRS